MFLSFGRVYIYKSICFEFHNYLGPTFCRMKDKEMKANQLRPLREYGLLNQWLKMSVQEREIYRVKGY